ncbi:hypothetical protein PROP_01251 [Propionicimonas sp. T2.31MG-18]|uniref:CPBP family intramembrane glutamic endopeptidase n=1 Tax=Propionicimonas sp. T2.31MG-18 TaxID=3157620 RepID=UPI0035EEF482
MDELNPTGPVSPPLDRATATRTKGYGAQLAWYFGGVVVVYLAGVAALWPADGGAPSSMVFLVVMFAPTVGALLARVLAGGRIQWGMATWWILAGLVPSATVLLTYLLGAGLGWYHLDASLLGSALLVAPVSILSACLSAVGEEIGWRGFLWPAVRQRADFWRSSLIVGVVWWLYHVPLILLGWYGSVSGLPAFTVAIVGFVLFVGVLTDRSHSLWPSVLAHGAWNAVVATSFAVITGATRMPAFSGAEALLGEFGWVAAVTVLALGAGVAMWHTRTSAQASAEESP